MAPALTFGVEIEFLVTDRPLHKRRKGAANRDKACSIVKHGSSLDTSTDECITHVANTLRESLSNSKQSEKLVLCARVFLDQLFPGFLWECA